MYLISNFLFYQKGSVGFCHGNILMENQKE